MDAGVFYGGRMLLRTYVFVFVVFVIGIFSVDAFAQSKTVFSGIPVIKVSEGGIERLADNLPRDKAVNLGCVISEISGKYYWATRENKEMISRISGAFITYIASDGSGYVRIINPKAKATLPPLSSTEERFDYIEHMLIGLRSVTYYGNAR